jgi:dTDP-4-amino-4,6-dideoxygalactose transaminase
MPTFGKAEINNLVKVIESGNFGDHAGGFMDKYKQAFAEAYGAKHCLTGATAMLLMQILPRAIGAEDGDEFICDPVVQFHGIACMHTNMIPVWADVRADNFLMDADKVEALITPRTRAIWVTHLWGFPAELDKLRKIADKHGIVLLEDAAHAVLSKYKRKWVGLWGEAGTYSHNMGKQLPTGEGGTLITNDDTLAFECSRRIIFGESPEVLSSNYRWNEFGAAVGLLQLKKVAKYLETYRKGKVYLDKAIADCDWLDRRYEHPGSLVSPYHWACIFRGERAGIEHSAFKNALRQVGAKTGVRFGTGFTQRPAYAYNVFRNHNWSRKVSWKAGLCPVAEDVIPRIVSTNNMQSVAHCRKAAAALREAIRLTESGTVEPYALGELERKVLDIVKADGPMEPIAVVAVLDKQGIHIDEHGAFSLMENLRDSYPEKLSHAGPRQFVYNRLG